MENIGDIVSNVTKEIEVKKDNSIVDDSDIFYDKNLPAVGGINTEKYNTPTVSIDDNLISNIEREYNLERAVTKDIDLINAKYDLSLLEMKIFHLFISCLEKSKDKRTVVFNYNELMNYCKTNIRDFKNALDTLYHRELVFNLYNYKNKKQKPILVKTRWIASYLFNPAFGTLTLTLPEDLVHVINNRVEPAEHPYVSLPAKNYVNVKSSYTSRLYELAYQYRTFSGGERPKMTIYDLRERLGIQAGAYKSFYYFRERVLDKAKSEIAANSDFTHTFDYRLEKSGNKYLFITLIAQPKMVDIPQVETPQSHEMVKKMSIDEVKSFLSVTKIDNGEIAKLDEEQLKYLAIMLVDKVNPSQINKYLQSDGFQFVYDNSEIALDRFNKSKDKNSSYGALFSMACKYNWSAEQKVKKEDTERNALNHMKAEKMQAEIRARIEAEQEEKQAAEQEKNENATFISDFKLTKLNESIQKYGKISKFYEPFINPYRKNKNPKVIEAVKMLDAGKEVPLNFFGDIEE